MHAIILNCSLKQSSKPSSTEALSMVLGKELEKRDYSYEIIRIADKNIPPGIESKVSQDDEWPHIRQQILDADILVLACPTWVGRLSSLAQKVIERMDAMLSETNDDGRPVAYNHVAGFVVTGNEDGAKHSIGEMEAALLELGFTVPGQAWTYFNNGAPMGKDYINVKDEDQKERAHRNARLAAHNLVALSNALSRQPIPAPPK